MENINWEMVYSLGLYILKTYPLKIIWNIVLFASLGVLLTVFYVWILRKFKALNRENKWYNRFVKLYIPALLILNLFFAMKIGLIRGIYKGLEADSFSICKQVYDTGSQQFFETEQEKREFITSIQTIASELQADNKNMKIELKDVVTKYDTKYGVVNKPKNWIAAKFIDKYGDRIHTLALYATLNSIPHANVSETMSYEEFDGLVKQLLQLDPKDIEKSVITKIQGFFMDLVKSQYYSIIQGIVIIWALLLLFPWIEFFIYSFIMKKKQKAKEEAHLENESK